MAQTKKRAERSLELDKTNKYSLKAYFYLLLTQLMYMFKWEGLDFRQEFIEHGLITRGYVAVGYDKETGKIYAGYLSYYEIDPYGLPLEGSPAELTTRGGFQFKGKIGEDIVIGYNSVSRLPDLTIEKYSEFFNETDISLKCALKKSRVLPMPVTSDSQVKTAIDAYLEDIDNGDTRAVAYDGALDDIVEGKPPVTMLELTEPKYTERLQYLSKFYDDMLRRFWTNYGHPLSSGSKMAQVTSMELEGYQTYARILPAQMLKEREEFASEISRISGKSVTVQYSEAWEHLNNPIELTEETANENTGDVQGNDTANDSSDADSSDS